MTQDSPGSVLRRVHAIAGTVALLTIAMFWTSSMIAEISGDFILIEQVKRAISWGLLILVPTMIATGGTGRKLAGPDPRGLAGKKYRRMKIIAALGLLVLMPCALNLSHLAKAGQYGTTFYIVQIIEFAAGATNITLLTRSFRDGLRLRNARRGLERRGTIPK